MDFGADLAMPLGARNRAAGAPTIPPKIMLPGSHSYDVPVDGTYTIRIWGGGYYGAGGFSKKTVRLRKGDALSFTIGKGLEGFTSNSGSYLQSPGNSSVTGPDISMQANAASSATGGTASGGDVNIQGGSAGYPSGSIPTSENSGASGSGSQGTVYDGEGGSYTVHLYAGGAAAGDTLIKGGSGTSSQNGSGPFYIIASAPGGGCGQGGWIGVSIPVTCYSAGDGLGVITYEG